MYHHYFPSEWLALREEVQLHDELVTILKLQPDISFEQSIAEIAAYCEIALDGYYDQTTILKIFDECTNRLKAKRTIHVSTIVH